MNENEELITLRKQVEELQTERKLIIDTVKQAGFNPEGNHAGLPGVVSLINHRREAQVNEIRRLMVRRDELHGLYCDARNALDRNNLWFWQDDEDDNLASLSCYIVIHPDVLRRIMAEGK